MVRRGGNTHRLEKVERGGDGGVPCHHVSSFHVLFTPQLLSPFPFTICPRPVRLEIGTSSL